MPTQLEIFNKRITDINNEWTTTSTLLTDEFNSEIQSKISAGSTLYKNGGYINIDDYKNILKINSDGSYGLGNLRDLNIIVNNDLITLENDIDAKIVEASGYTVNESVINASKKEYLDNKRLYIQNKDKIHGALIQAKTQNENYNYLVSSTINLICGILILFYLIYKIYTPITVEELKTAVKTTGETASKVAKQAQTATNKIVSK